MRDKVVPACGRKFNIIMYEQMEAEALNGKLSYTITSNNNKKSKKKTKLTLNSN